MTLASAHNRDTVPLKGLISINICSVFIYRHCSNSFWNSAADNQRNFCCNNLWERIAEVTDIRFSSGISYFLVQNYVNFPGAF